MTFRSTLLAALLFAATAAPAQVGKKAFYIHSALGLSMPGASDLNTVLQRNGHLPLNNAFFARGGGFYAFFNNTRLVQLFTFQSYTGSNEAGVRRSWARGTQVGTAFGIDLKRKGRLQAIPYLGAAYSFFGLRLSNTSGNNTSVDGYLFNTANQHHIETTQWLANLGLHLGASPVGYKGFAQKVDVAVRTGYCVPLSQGAWKTSGNALRSGPDVNTGGFYTTLVLGLRQ